MKNKFKKIIFGLILTGSSVFSQTPTDGLVAYYPFNGNANNKSGNEHHGTVNGASLTTDRCGKENSAYLFSSLSTYINCDSLNFKDKSFSISLWIKNEGDSTYGTGEIFSHGDSRTEQHNLHIRINPDKTMRFSFFGLSGLNIDTDVQTEEDKWYNAVFSYNYVLKQVKIYLNGELIKSGVFSGDYLGGNTMYLGKSLDSKHVNGRDAFFNGKLDDIRIYDRTLDALEIQSLYDAESCSSTNKLLSITDVGIKDVKGLVVYPNPTTKELRILVPSENYSRVSIYSITGRQVYNGELNSENETVNVGSFYPGIYLIKISNGSEMLCKKFVKM